MQGYQEGYRIQCTRVSMDTDVIQGIQLIQFTGVLRVHDTDSDAPLNNRYKNMTPINLYSFYFSQLFHF